MNDNRLSFGARCLYFHIDDCARGSGKTFASQAFFARRLAISERQIRTLLNELEEIGYISIHRGRRTAAEVRLFWVDQDRKFSSGQEEQDRNFSSGLEPQDRKDSSAQEGQDRKFSSVRPEVFFQRYLIESGFNQGSIDRGQDRTNTSGQDQKVRWMLEVLAEYPDALQRIGCPPDETVARACLEAGGWDTAAIAQALRETYLRNGRRSAPEKAWPWFVTVLRRHFGSARV